MWGRARTEGPGAPWWAWRRTDDCSPPRQVAERLGYTERYVWKLGREVVLPRIKLPGRKYVRFAEEDVERLVQQGRPGLGAAGARRAVVRSSVPLPRRF